MSEMNLLGTLGLNAVSADPDDVPVGNYDAVIHASELVLNSKKDTVSHVITFKLTGEEHKGAKPTQWNKLGDAPRNAQGEFPAKVTEIATYQPTMGDQQKQYYKKTWVDCGVPDAEVGTLPPEALVGKAVSIRVYLNNGFKNVAVNGPLSPEAAGPTSVNIPNF